MLALLCLLIATLPAWGAAEVPYQPDEHTVLLLHLDAEGETATDSSASGLAVTLQAEPQRPQFEPDGFLGGCLRFDGDNEDAAGDGEGDADGLTFRDDGELAADEGLTVEAWILPERLSGKAGILARAGSSAYNFFVADSGLYFDLVLETDEGRKGIALTVPGGLTLGRWQHFAATWDGAAMRLFIDGVQVARQEVAGRPYTGPSGNHIGRDGDSRPGQIRGFAGLIDEIRVSDIAREQFNVSPGRTDAFAMSFAPPAVMPPPPDRPRYDDPPVPPLNERRAVVTGRVIDEMGGPLAGVLVSDGERVVRTDDAGGYRLEFDVDDLRVVFVTRPRGYRPVDTCFLRIPRGDAATEYAHDFVFAPDELADRASFNFLSTGDTQFGETATFGQLLAEFDQFTRMSGDPGFLTVAGDLTISGCQWEMDMYRDVAARSHLPVLNVFGGHDGNYARKTTGKLNVYNYQLNLAPAWYSWDYGPVHFATWVSETGYLTAEQRERQSAWLEADLAAQPPGTPIMLTTHIPPANSVMQGWLDRYNIIGLLFGHWHAVQCCGYGGVPYLETGPMRGRDWGAFSRLFRVVSIDEGELTTEIRVCGQDQRLDIVAPQGTVGRGIVPVQVKAYDTARRVTSVTCEIKAGDQTDAVALTRTGAWTWEGMWDCTGAAPGPVTVRATATDEDGRSWEHTTRCELADRERTVAGVGEDWPGFFRTEHSRVRDAPLDPPLELAWAANTGGRNAKAVSPVVYGGRVYVGVEHKEVGHPNAGVCCYDAATGEQVWKSHTDASINSGVAAGHGMVYAIDVMGQVYGFDAATGEERWRADPFPPDTGRSDVRNTPLLYGDELMATNDYGWTVFLRATTGELLRMIRPGVEQMYYTFPSMHDGRVLMPCFSRKLVAADAQTGEVVWTQDAIAGISPTCPVPLDGAIYVNAWDGLTCVDEATGEKRWDGDVRPSGKVVNHSAAVPVGDIVLTNGRALRAFDTATGELRWQVDHLYTAAAAEHNQRQTLAGLSTPAVAGEVLYVGADDGYLQARALADGRLLWRYNLGVPVKSSPVLSGNALYVCDWDGNLYCFTGAL